MDYFSNIVPCGIPDKQVTSLSKELGASQDMELVRTQLKSAFQEVFQIDIKD
jgi:lipoyl(octanoyl) transferase